MKERLVTVTISNEVLYLHFLSFFLGEEKITVDSSVRGFFWLINERWMDDGMDGWNGMGWSGTMITTTPNVSLPYPISSSSSEPI